MKETTPYTKYLKRCRFCGETPETGITGAPECDNWRYVKCSNNYCPLRHTLFTVTSWNGEWKGSPNIPSVPDAISEVHKMRERLKREIDGTIQQSTFARHLSSKIEALTDLLARLKSFSPASAAPVVDEQQPRRLIGSSRHPHFTTADHERMKETLDALSDYPTEEEAEAVLQACGTSGKEVVNEFIERLLRENLELKNKLAAAATAAPVEQQTPQTKLIDAVIYAVKEGCFFPVPEPKPGASVQELAQWGAMRNLHDAIAAFTREWKLGEGAR